MQANHSSPGRQTVPGGGGKGTNPFEIPQWGSAENILGAAGRWNQDREGGTW